MNDFRLNNAKNIIIIGAGHGIGFALVKYIINKNKDAQVFATYRKKEKADELLQLEKDHSRQVKTSLIDPTKEEEVAAFHKNLNEKIDSIDLLINAVGFLDNDKYGPEKALKDINAEQLQEYFLVNTIVSLLVAKYFYPLYRGKKPSAFVAISAKVGSIGDNGMGGWYGYRISKTALNMAIKNISIEWKRQRYNTFVAAIHPGTTITALSKPYIENTNLKLHTADETATNILSVIEGKGIDDSGSFYSWDGSSLPW